MIFTAAQLSALPVLDTCDVLIAGGGVAGVAAALSAARTGAKVTLIEREYALGGLATLGLITYYLPLCDGMGRQVSFGLAEELLRLSISQGAEGEYPQEWFENGDLESRVKHRYRTRFNPQLFALLCEQELLRAGVRLIYGCEITDVQTDANGVRQIVVQSRLERGVIRAKTYVDATGDAILAAAAGETTRSFEQGNILAAWYYMQEAAGARLRVLGAADIPDRHKNQQNSGPKLLTAQRFTGLDTLELSDMTMQSHDAMLREVLARRAADPAVWPVTMATIPQVRMTRCVQGRVVLDDTAPHCHEPRSIGMISNWRKPGPVYELPFDILQGTRVPNLYAAGRCVSVTDAMWDLTRVIPACAVTGEAAGLAAAMHARDGAAPDIAALQKSLVQTGVVLHENP